VGNIIELARFEDRRSRRHGDIAAFGITDTNDVALALHIQANAAREQRQQQQCAEPQEDSLLEEIEKFDLVGGRRIGVDLDIEPEARVIRDHSPDGPTGRDKAEKTEHGEQKREAVEPGQAAREPGFEAQPVVDADTGMHPDHERCRCLANSVGQGIDPECQQDIGVGVSGVERLHRRAGAQNMADQQDRCSEPEDELQRFTDAHFKAPAAVECVQRKHHVDHKRSEEERGAYRIAPCEQEIVSAGLHRFERDQAERVVREMGEHENEQNQAAAKA